MKESHEWPFPKLVEFIGWDIVSYGEDTALKHGWSGETCGSCKRTLNVPHGPGFFCECGHFNEQSFSHHQMLYKNPDFGPSFLEFQLAFHLASVKKLNEKQVAKEPVTCVACSI